MSESVRVVTKRSRHCWCLFFDTQSIKLINLVVAYIHSGRTSYCCLLSSKR